MTTTTHETRTHMALRQNAEVKLQAGIAPGTQGWTVGTAALTLLHSLASNPSTASDALKLLHELQVHQVELDLQHEHMEEDRKELTQLADHYAELYDFAPVAYFTADKTGNIIEGNLTTTRMLGTTRDDLEGRSIDSLVTPDSGPAVRALLEQARSSGMRQSCRAQAGDGSGWLELTAIASPQGPYCLVVATALTDTSTPPPRFKLAEPGMSTQGSPLLSRATIQANRLLAVMPDDALERLLPAMRTVSLKAGDVLYDQGTDLTHLYFLADTIATLLLKLEGRNATKVAVVGNEGVVGVSAFMGGSQPPGSAVVLSPGHAFSIPAATLKAEFDRMGPVMRLLLRYTQSLVTQMAQTAVCNRHHVVEQQLCAWLLACRDRLKDQEMTVTQEVIAGLLGVRREGITEAAGTLRALGLIAYSRGHISVLNHEGVQARACECYQVVKRETERLLPDRPAI